MPFVDGRFVMRSQLLINESGEAQKAISAYSPASFPVFREKVIALQLGYTTEDARIFGSAQRQDTWVALLEAHDTGALQPCSAECDARKDCTSEDTQSRKIKQLEHERKLNEKKLEAIERRKLREAKREAAIAVSFAKAASAPLQTLVTYWLDTRNGNVLHQRPTAIQCPEFYTQLKNRAVVDDYYAYAAKHGKKEAVAVYGHRGTLLGRSLVSEKKLDAIGDTRCDYVTETYSHFPVVESEQFKRPKKWAEKLTEKELLALGCCKISQFRNLQDGSCFVDTLGRRWWKIVAPKQFNFDTNPTVRRSNQPRARIMYCR